MPITPTEALPAAMSDDGGAQDSSDSFMRQAAASLPPSLDGFEPLPLERIVSKRASGQPKDLAALPALEEALAALRGKI